ncbi:hypothetical protein L1280_001893 [Deinococcus sp. HSC-46F16]|uniref:hypothetical protein n=1 Tax=Deinococcus sp. HSC-46F16 TaxID=2910968 RepID=UPI0020A20D14|nr:hypothetical protein [Deinococcus sp. HSC-46F16]MCP2014741.1 hypothetical protein [Deinococcus sp. HSC-46F16]
MLGRSDPVSSPVPRPEGRSTAPDPGTVEVRVPVRPLVLALALGVVLVIAAGLLGQLGPLLLPGFHHPEFSAGTNLYGEYNIPSTYNTLLLLLAAVTLWLTGRVARRRGDPFARTWTGLAALALFLTLDEYFALHDKLGAPIRALLGLGGFLYYAWVIPYGLLVLGVGVLLVRFLRHLPAGLRRALLLAGGLYVLGALGLEVFEARIEAGAAGEGLGRAAQLQMVSLIAVEELLEMSSLVLLIAALLGHLRRTAPGLALRLRLGDSGE